MTLRKAPARLRFMRTICTRLRVSAYVLDGGKPAIGEDPVETLDKVVVHLPVFLEGEPAELFMNGQR